MPTLTEKQDAHIDRYVQHVGEALDASLPASYRDHSLGQLKRRIQQELAALMKDAVEDGDVQHVLDKFGTPAQQAQTMAPRDTGPKQLRLDNENRVWLGVCAGVARYVDAESWMVRLGFFVGGLFTGPLAVFLYVGLYGYLYAEARKREKARPPAEGKETPPIDYIRLVWRVVSIYVIAVVLSRAVGYVIQFIYFAHEKYLQRPMPPLGEWGWIEYRAGDYYVYAIGFAVPLAILSGLPLANGWDHSLKRVAQAGLAVYGLMLSYGIASMLVGIILDFVSEFSGQFDNLMNLNNVLF